MSRGHPSIFRRSESREKWVSRGLGLQIGLEGTGAPAAKTFTRNTLRQNVEGELRHPVKEGEKLSQEFVHCHSHVRHRSAPANQSEQRPIAASARLRPVTAASSRSSWTPQSKQLAGTFALSRRPVRPSSCSPGYAGTSRRRPRISIGFASWKAIKPPSTDCALLTLLSPSA
jgi:hypothetical protein